MIPYYKIEVEKKDKTKEFMTRASGITVIDQDGFKSDSCEITLQDKGDLEIPDMDTKVKLYLGIKGKGLTYMGSFLLVDPDLGPGYMKLKGKAAPVGKEFSSPREVSWDNKSFGEIAESIAKRHNLKAAVEQSLYDKKVESVIQTGSDMSFLTTLGMRKNATFKVQNGYLVFSSNESQESVFGKKLPVVTITSPSSWNYKGAASSEYTGVKSFYRCEGEQGKRESIQVGSSSNVFEMIQTWDSLSQAQERAKIKLKDLQKNQITLSISKSSDEHFNSTNIASGQTTIIKGVRKNVDGKWRVKKVSHSFTSDRLAMSAELEQIVN